MHSTDTRSYRLSAPRYRFLTSSICCGRILLSTLTMGGGRINGRGTHSLEASRVIRCLMLLDDLSAVLALHEIVLQSL